MGLRENSYRTSVYPSLSLVVNTYVLRRGTRVPGKCTGCTKVDWTMMTIDYRDEEDGEFVRTAVAHSESSVSDAFLPHAHLMQGSRETGIAPVDDDAMTLVSVLDLDGDAAFAAATAATGAQLQLQAAYNFIRPGRVYATCRRFFERGVRSFRKVGPH